MEKKSIKRKNLLHIVNKLHALFYTSSSENREDLSLAIKIVGAFERWHTCEGLHGLKRAKAMTNYFVRQLMGTPLESIPLSNRYKRLIEKALLRCVNTRSKVYWVSVFSSARLFYTAPLVDVSTITGRFEGRLRGLLKWKYFSNFSHVNKSFRSRKSDQNWTSTFKWHISGSGGPNGLLAYTQYLNDLRCLSHSWLSVGLLILFIALPYDNKRDTVKALRNALLDSVEKGEEGSIHSRLVFLSDKGGKTRVVAIGDILSQSLLQTVHHRCNLFLRRLSQDGTFDQDRSRRYVKKLSGKSLPLASIDLTAATDRMPVLFQVYVVVSLRILTPLQAFGWWWVTTNRDFVYKDGDSVKRTRYAVGQPMGLMSSWPVMAISHHYLVRLAFAAAGRSSLGDAPYSVLGDDLTLLGHDVAGEYLNLIDCLGMKFSPEKTYISVGVAEFAKSLYCHGEDLTPFPIALLGFNKNTIVSNTLAIISECKRINLPLTAQTLMGLYPLRWRNLVLLASLSPSSPQYGLDLLSRSDQWVFLQFIFAQKIKYFARLNTVRDSTHVFAFSDPGSSGFRGSSPYLQIGLSNSESYPVTRLRDDKTLSNPLVLLGSGWISYCSKSWPHGLPLMSDRKLIPGPTWKDVKEKELFLQSNLTKFNKLLPGYFTVRCVGHQVGE
jgi:hypothetical protein